MENTPTALVTALTAITFLGCSLAACGGNPDTAVGGDSGTGSGESRATAAIGSDASVSPGSSSAATSGALGSGAGSSTASSGATSAAGSTTSSVASTTGVSTGLTLITEPGDGLTPIYNLIRTATQTLDMTMYELTDTTMTGLLTTAAKNGVKVRVILDQNLEKSSNESAYSTLGGGGVSVHWANPTYSATHQKTITVDGTTSAIMTLNLTPEYYSTSRDFAVITTDAADVAAIESTFDDDFTNAAVTPKTGDDLVWSPTNAQSSLVDIINGAKTTLTTENEEMSDTAIVSALESAASRGVDVKVVMTASSSWDSDFTKLKSAGVKVVTYAASASLYIHAKIVLADYGTSTAKLFLGSENYSSASLTKNRELGLITTDGPTMTSMSATLASDYGGGTAYSE